MATTYAEKLKDPRWQKRRLEILEDRGWTCERCDDSGSTLHVHHGYYAKGRDPWDYEDKYLWVLCESCHLEIGEATEQIHSAIAQIHPAEIPATARAFALAERFEKADQRGFPCLNPGTLLSHAVSICHLLNRSPLGDDYVCDALGCAATELTDSSRMYWKLRREERQAVKSPENEDATNSAS